MPERPSELIYALDERPPWPQLVALGFQHVAVICPYLVMVALVTEAAKLPHAAAQSAIGLAMIAVAFMTILQSLRLGPVGSGYLCPPVVSAIYLPSSLAAAAWFGISAVCGMVIFAGACEIGVASLVNRTRKLFPAVVSGVVIMAVGLELGRIAAAVLFEHNAAHSGQTVRSFATVACALAAMTGLAVWATGLPKLFCSLIGILVGYVAAAAFQVYSPDFLADFQAARSRSTIRHGAAPTCETSRPASGLTGSAASSAASPSGRLRGVFVLSREPVVFRIINKLNMSL
jgi:xanthine permease XanP